MSSKLTIVVGLPGSGKSHYIRERSANVAGSCVEDYMAFPYDDSRHFTDSQYYSTLVSNLRGGKDCIIADIFFCDTALRNEAEQVIAKDCSSSIIEWIFFANDPKSCRENATRRNRKIVDHDLVMIDKLTRKYFIPLGSTELPVWREK
ncbi:MAG: hypothetical protein KDD62_11980 [Bdellovibrionales bacterium]|nr:hypothetical protein [Bdellovibrionales bacterium]